MGYLRFSFPEHKYEPLITKTFAAFEKPVYMNFSQKQSPDGEFWFDLNYPHYGTTIHFSYKPVKSNLTEMIEDVHYFVYKHTVKASGIEDFLVNYPENRVYGIVYRIRGDVASNIQFVVTDSVKHFLRGSLYIMSRPNEDSLAPIIDFARRDIEHMLKNLRWK
jgi:gliding motility-associated lipoprotein GldD